MDICLFVLSPSLSFCLNLRLSLRFDICYHLFAMFWFVCVFVVVGCCLNILQRLFDNIESSDCEREIHLMKRKVEPLWWQNHHGSLRGSSFQSYIDDINTVSFTIASSYNSFRFSDVSSFPPTILCYSQFQCKRLNYLMYPKAIDLPFYVDFLKHSSKNKAAKSNRNRQKLSEMKWRLLTRRTGKHRCTLSIISFTFYTNSTKETQHKRRKWSKIKEYGNNKSIGFCFLKN